MDHKSEQRRNAANRPLWLPLSLLAALIIADLCLIMPARLEVLPPFWASMQVKTVFSAAQLGAAGLLVLFKGSAAEKRQRYAWFGLGLFFFFLAFDELAEIHEYLSIELASVLGLPSKTLAEILVLAAYAAIVMLTPIRRLGDEVFRDPFSKATCIIAAAFLALWILGNAAPPIFFRWPETGLKLIGFSFLLAAAWRQALINIRPHSERQETLQPSS